MNKDLFENYRKILTVISPVIPHFSSECLEELKLNAFQEWPMVDKKLLDTETIEYVIQINGKKRGIIKTSKNLIEKSLLEEIRKNENTKKIIENKKINKTFFVKNRLINILIK